MRASLPNPAKQRQTAFRQTQQEKYANRHFIQNRSVGSIPCRAIFVSAQAKRPDETATEIGREHSIIIRHPRKTLYMNILRSLLENRRRPLPIRSGVLRHNRHSVRISSSSRTGRSNRNRSPSRTALTSTPRSSSARTSASR